MLVLFTFFTVIYLMNLFIGLLNMAIDDNYKYEEFLLQQTRPLFINFFKECYEKVSKDSVNAATTAPTTTSL